MLSETNWASWHTFFVRQRRKFWQIDASDGRRLEIVATGLPLFKGVPLGVDVTLVSPLHTDGSIWDKADTEPGIALTRAEKDKARTYPELIDSAVLRLVTMACETGGRWNDTTSEVLRKLANARARDAPGHLRFAAALGWQRRWWSDAVVLLDGHDGPEPLLSDVIA